MGRDSYILRDLNNDKATATGVVADYAWEKPKVVQREINAANVQIKAAKQVSFIGLFRYASGYDYPLIFFGLLCAASQGALFQFNFMLVGQICTQYINYTIAVRNNTNLTMQLDVGLYVSRFCIVAAVTLVVGYIHIACWCTTAGRQVRVIRKLMFSNLLKQHMGWFDMHSTGELYARLTDDVNNIQNGLGDKLATFVQWTSQFVAGIIFGFITGWEMTLVMLAVSPVAILAAGSVSFIIQSFGRKESEAYAKAGSVAEEVLSSIRTVAAYNGETRETERYATFLVDARRIGIKRGFISGLGQGVLWICVFGTLSLGLWFGAYLVREYGYEPGVVLQIILFVYSGTRALGQAVGNIESISLARSSAAEIFNIIDQKSEIDSSSDEGLRPAGVHGDINFRGVDFAYPARPDIQLLRELNLEVKQGQTVALTGPSGCGKSTIIGLLLRFYDPMNGHVYLDGNSTSDINIKWLRENIGYVGQKPVLFTGTVAENIRFGKDDATAEEIRAAATRANAHEFIMKLPMQYDTMVGEAGTAMSGGQRQRIAIARALVSDPKILLLDEATSALDYESEAIVQDALDKAAQGRTTIVIAHRLSTIRNADNILCIIDGKIVENGKHEELMAKEGFYYQLVLKQTQVTTEKEDPLSSGNEIEVKGEVAESVKDRKESVAVSVVDAIYEVPLYDDEDGKVEYLQPPSFRRLAAINRPESCYIVLGCLGALFQGAVFPGLAVFFSDVIGAFGMEDKKQMEEQVNVYVLAIVLIGVGAFFFTFTMVSMFALSGERLTERLRKWTFQAMLKMEMGWYDEDGNQVGTLTSKLATDASMVKGATGSQLGALLNACSTVMLSLVVCFTANWKLAFAVMAFIPLLVACGFLQAKALTGFAKGDKDAMEQGVKICAEAIENIRTVASLTKEQWFVDRYLEHGEKMYQKSIKRAQVFGITWGISQSVVFFCYATAFGVGTYLMETEGWSFISVFRILIATITSAVELGRINAFTADYSRAKVAAAKIFDLLDRESAIDPLSEEGIKPETCTGGVTFDMVQFFYPTRHEVTVLKGLSLDIKTGQTLALVGPSGCGKSTAMQLIERFYDPTNGAVMVDGIPVQDLNVEWLRSQIAMVSEEPVLFNTSIKENIRYGAVLEVTDADVIQAAKNANIHNFISELPQGYETSAGGKGTQLSGGQKQRVAIARALIRNPKILLLDQATSALDADSEKIVQSALDSAREGRTCITIAHRLSTIQNADKIAFMDNGKVLEVGSHQELIQLQGRYYTLCQGHNKKKDKDV